MREIGFPGGADAGWYQKLMTAHYEFVQVLGALRDVMGDAIFVLRLISQPHPLIPVQRGSMTVVLLARVSSATPEICRAHALQLWTDMHAILPLGQENIYIFYRWWTKTNCAVCSRRLNMRTPPRSRGAKRTPTKPNSSRRLPPAHLTSITCSGCSCARISLP